MGNDIGVELGELDSLSGRLKGAADGMNGAPSKMADPPNCGQSTAAVLGMLEKLTRSAAALTETASKASGDVESAKSTYGTSEADRTDVFKNIS
jgi:hypothetical protein